MSDEQQHQGPGRPRLFDETMFLKEAVHLFWKDGYDNVSINQLANSSGLTRSSVYHSFGSKDAIFLAALQQYIKDHPISRIMTLSPEDNAANLLFELFDEFARFLDVEANHRGCFVANETSRLLDRPGEPFDSFRAMFVAIDAAMLNCIKLAKKQGSLANPASAVTINRVLSAYISGLSTISKSGLSQRQLKAMSRVFLTNLGFDATGLTS